MPLRISSGHGVQQSQYISVGAKQSDFSMAFAIEALFFTAKEVTHKHTLVPPLAQELQAPG
jgi:hypothetical protein